MTFFADYCPDVSTLFISTIDSLIHHTPINTPEQPTIFESVIAPIADLNPILMFHILSPLLYMGFVALITRILSPCPKSGIMKFERKYHNVVLSLLSAAMLGGTIIGTLYDQKFSGIHTAICKPYSPQNDWIIFTSTVFLFSKYLEWGIHCFCI